MAVAFSTGGSGYTRSDFMISDAAIPARVEEAAKADQKEQFSKVLSGIGSSRNASNASNASNTSGAGSANNAVSGSDAASGKMAQNNAVSEKETPASYEKFEMLRSELTKSDGSLDLRKVVAAIADGKLTFADIPQEYITKALLADLINTVENVDNTKSDKDDSEQNNDPAVQQVMTELTAMMNQTALPEDISDLSDEISALTIKITGADEVQAVQQNVPEQAVQTVQNQAEQAEATGEAVEFTFKPETEQKSQAQAKPVQEIQSEAKQAAVTAAAVQNAENTGAQSEAQTDAGQSGQSGQQDGAAQVQTAQAGQTEQAPQEDVKFRSDVRSVEVRTAEKPQEAPQQEQTQVFADHTAQRSRVVFKSDELEAIKSGDAAQAQPQGIPAESPVVFTRQDGAEITVKPSEVAQQVSGKITERAADLKEGAVEYSITLDPEDLGRITVRMTKTADGAVSVSIAAENSKTMKIIEDNGSAIQDTLRQNGVQLENWQTVSESRQEPQAQDYQGSSKNPYRENENHRQDDDRDGESFAEIIASM